MEITNVHRRDSNRDLRFDGLKFVMIFLVVLGHLRYNDFGLRVGRIIYSFHMPVFIFLSGYFTSLCASEEKQKKWIKKSFLIYFIAQFTHWMLRIGLEFIADRIKDVPFDTSIISWKVLISPELALWYLVCLLYWRVAIWKGLQKISDVKLVLISIVLAFFSGFIPIDHDFAFQRAFAFFPFFAFITGW